MVRRSAAAAQCYTVRRARPPHRRRRSTTDQAVDLRQAAHDARAIEAAWRITVTPSRATPSGPTMANRRAPKYVPSVLMFPPAMAAAPEQHWRLAASPPRVNSLSAITTAARDSTGEPREKNESRAVRITVRAHPRPLVITPAADGCSAVFGGTRSNIEHGYSSRTSFIRVSLEGAYDGTTCSPNRMLRSVDLFVNVNVLPSIRN